jgi:hypothetical protein
MRREDAVLSSRRRYFEERTLTQITGRKSRLPCLLIRIGPTQHALV